MFNRQHQLEYLAGLMDRKPLIVAPYDAELFGTGGLKGPTSELLLPQNRLRPEQLPADHSQRIPGDVPHQPGSGPQRLQLGPQGYNEVWLEKSNEWIYRHLHKAGERMINLVNDNRHAGGLKARALNQAARELLLAQSSDWAFIMKSGTMVDYAIRRTKTHLHNFTRLFYAICEDRYDEPWLEQLEAENNIFPNINYRVFSSDYRGTVG